MPPEVAIPAAAVVAGSLPFIGQAVAGLGVSGLGAGLAGLGIAGAFGVGGQTRAQVTYRMHASGEPPCYAATPRLLSFRRYEREPCFTGIGLARSYHGNATWSGAKTSRAAGG